MRACAWLIVVVGVLSVRADAAGGFQQAPAQAGKGTPSIEDALKAYRNDIQGARSDIMAKNLTLTADQAAKFWPAYAKFQEEQAVIVDAQLLAMQKYAENYKTLDDAGALAQVNANLTRDQQMMTLRTKWLAEFQKILPARIAARAIQLDRRLGIAHQLLLSSQIPLIY